MPRTSLTVLVASLVVLAAVPTGAAALSLGLSGEDPYELPQATGGTKGQPSWVVTLNNESGAVGALNSWANRSAQRVITRLDNESKTATLRAPTWSVNGGFLSRLTASMTSLSLANLTPEQLTEESYIQSIQPNYQHSVSPVDVPIPASEFEAPGSGGWFSFDDPEFPTDGIAFADGTNKTPMADAREAVNGSAGAFPSAGAGQTIAVVDSHICLNNGRVFGNGTAGSDLRVLNASKNMITGETVGENGTDALCGQNPNYHGTWTAAAAAGNPNGTTFDAIASNASLLGIEALNSDGSGSTSDIASGIRYAADHDADVISLSLGSPLADEAIASAVRYAYDNGVDAVVTAAGNSRQLSPGLGSPADVPAVISVGATNGTTNLSQTSSAYFSQYSGYQAADGNASTFERVDVVAPGFKITTKTPTKDGFAINRTLSGTSMSTPIVASGIAAALAENATLEQMTHAELHAAVRQSAVALPNLAKAEAGDGMFNAKGLRDGSVLETDQPETMDAAATQRQTVYAGLDTAAEAAATAANATA